MTAPAATAPAPGPEPIEIPDAGVQRYLDRFGVSAVYVIAGPAGFPCVLGSGTDLGDALKAARRSWPPKLDPPLLAAAWWTFDGRAAQQVVSLVVASDLRLARRDGPRFAVSTEEATRAITAAAGRLHFRLTDHASVMARAKATGVALEDKLSAAQATGDLKPFHAEYQRRRVKAQAAGRKFMSYNEARTRLRAVLAAAASGRPVGDVLAKCSMARNLDRPRHWRPLRQFTSTERKFSDFAHRADAQLHTRRSACRPRGGGTLAQRPVSD